MPIINLCQQNSWYNYGTISPNNCIVNVVGYTGPSSTLVSYPLSTGSNIWYDISSYNNNVGLTRYQFTGLEKAFSFTGTSTTGGYAITPDLQTYITTNQTQEIWIKNAYYSSTGGQGVVLSEQGTSIPNTIWYYSQIEIVGNTGYIGVWNGSGITKIPVGLFTTPVWHHVGWRYSSTGLFSAFYDGVLVGSQVVTRVYPMAYGYGLYESIGSRCPTNMGNGNYYSGLIGGYRTYNRDLSPQEIYQNFQYESQFYGGKQTIRVNVIAPNETALWYQDVLNKIVAGMTGSWNDKSLIITQNNTSSYAGSDLTTANFDVVFIWTDSSFSNTALGTNLQNFIISGGGLVICVFAIASLALPNTFNYTYTPIIFANNQSMASSSLGTYDSSDPLMKNVTNFNPGTSKYGAGNLNAQAGATTVAQYNDGNRLVVKKTIGTARTVALNFFPPSSVGRSDFWTSSTDGGKLMANAIVWAGRGVN